jgi:dihydroxy-acid dehydratase
MLMPEHIDLVLLITGLLLAATLTAFFAGVFLYPFGFFILGFVMLGRILQLRSKKK